MTLLISSFSPRVVYHVFLSKGLSIKDVRSQGGEGVCPVRIFFGQGESSSDADVRTFGCKDFRIFRNLWCVRFFEIRVRNLWYVPKNFCDVIL